MYESDLDQIEVTIEEARAAITLSDQLERLYKNKDFRKIILEGYLRDEAIRLVSIKASPNMQEPERQNSILKDIDGIGSFITYMHTIRQVGYVAKRSLEADEQTRDSLMGMSENVQ